ncbi:MAG: hypothetical protein ACRDRG_20025 [Pseudonocardiaceae bacterium]
MEVWSSGPPWLAITIAGISLAGVVVTAVVGPIVVERRKSNRVFLDPPESAVIAQRASDAVTLIQSEITDLQHRVGRLEALQMADARGRH